jgi:zinc finger protein
MASDEQNTPKQNPSEFFESIGSKVANFSSTPNGTTEEVDDVQPVQEVESLCMNCHQNVS